MAGFDPISAGLTLGTSVLSSVLSGKAKANQAALDEKQLKMTQKQLDEEAALARDAQRMSKASTTDAQGNRSYYDDASNSWNLALTPKTKSARDASMREQMDQGYDAQIYRGQQKVNADRRTSEGSLADTLRRKYEQQLATPAYNGDQIASQLRLDRTRAANAGVDQVGAAMGSQALRSGTAGTRGLVEALARARGAAQASAMGSPELEGMQAAAGMNGTNATDTANQYNLFAGRASNIGDNSFAPETITAGIAGGQGDARDSASTGSSNAAQVLGSAAKAGQGAYTALKPSVSTTGSDILGDLSTFLGAAGGSDALSRILGGKRSTAGASPSLGYGS